ncbi:hypothetical protein B566_EDAN001051 [Ephemera danica]|nr:hypothetical protein B566_EDAN001051 [Ephemera danica]
MSSSEMRNLVMYFGLMVGRYIPEEDEYWKLYISLRKIFELTYARVLQESCHHHISQAVNDHHTLYQQLTKNNLKPKHHIVTHYFRVFQLAGPLGNICSCRFEANHKDLKEFARLFRCRKNLTYSLAMFNQLFHSNRLQLRESIDSDFTVGPDCKGENSNFENKGSVNWLPLVNVQISTLKATYGRLEKSGCKSFMQVIRPLKMTDPNTYASRKRKSADPMGSIDLEPEIQEADPNTYASRKRKSAYPVGYIDLEPELQVGTRGWLNDADESNTNKDLQQLKNFHLILLLLL